MSLMLRGIIFGIVEGISEWLPISSTGHMLLLSEILPLEVSQEFWSLFLVLIQLAAVLAVCVVFFHTLNPFSPAKTGEERHATWLLWAKTLVACVPAAVLGILFDDLLEEYLETPVVIALALIFYGILFIVIEKRRGRAACYRPRHAAAAGAPKAAAADGAAVEPSSVQSLDDLSWQQVFGIGVFQLLALVPGTSRSGATIIGGLILGCSRQVAAEFTFFLAIPVMMGASLLRLVKYVLKGAQLSSGELMVLGAGSLVAFIVSLVVVRFFIAYVRKHDFKIFGWYRILLGSVVLAWFLLGGSA